MFEKGLRNKYRFNYNGHGQISLERLWDLSLEELNIIYKELYSQKNKEEENSLLQKKTSFSEIIDDKINIVKHIFMVKQTEIKNMELEKIKKQEKEKLIRILEIKKDKSLEDLSIEELTEKINQI